MTARDNIDRALREDAAKASPANGEQKPKLLGLSLGEALKSAASEAIDLLEGRKPPIETEWPSVNRRLGGGLHQRRSYVIVGGTGAGKSQFAIQLALHAAKNGAPVAYFSAELDEIELSLRLLGVESKMKWSSLLDYSDRVGSLSRLSKAMQVEDAVRRLPIHIFGRDSGVGLDSAVDVVRDLRAHYPVKGENERRPILIVADYLQVFAGQLQDKGSDQLDRVSRAARLIKDSCLRENATAVILSATSRRNSELLTESGGTGNPSDLVGYGRDSSEVEYSADGVFVLADATPKDDQPNNDGPREMHIAAAKLRMARPCWMGPFHFDGNRFELASNREDSTVPRPTMNDRGKL